MWVYADARRLLLRIESTWLSLPWLQRPHWPQELLGDIGSYITHPKSGGTVPRWQPLSPLFPPLWKLLAVLGGVPAQWWTARLVEKGLRGLRWKSERDERRRWGKDGSDWACWRCSVVYRRRRLHTDCRTCTMQEVPQVSPSFTPDTLRCVALRRRAAP